MKTFIFILLFCLNSFAAKAKVSKAPDAKEFNLKVVYGDRLSEFKVNKNSKGGQIHFFNNNGQEKMRSLDEKDINFLFSEYKKMKGSNNIHLCDQRHYMEISSGTKKSVSCLGSSTKIAKQMTGMSNLLLALLR